MKAKMFYLITKVLCIMILTVAMVSPVFAIPVVDGRFDPSEGYTTGFYVDFKVETGKKNQGNETIVSGGQLWLFQDQDPKNNDLFVAFIQPLTLVDNSYGTNAIGWGLSAPSGKNHKFQDLIGSDDAQFVFTDGFGAEVLDITIDYLHGFGAKKGDPPYASGGVTYGEGKVNVGSGLDVIVVGTSLQYNYETFGATNPSLFGKDSDSPAADANYNVTDPLLSDWVFEVIYEIQVHGNLFADNGFGGVDIPLVHDSPNKIDKNKVWPEIGAPVPEPPTLLLLSSGLAAIALGRKRLSKKL